MGAACSCSNVHQHEFGHSHAQGEIVTGVGRAPWGDAGSRGFSTPAQGRRGRNRVRSGGVGRAEELEEDKSVWD